MDYMKKEFGNKILYFNTYRSYNDDAFKIYPRNNQYDVEVLDPLKYSAHGINLPPFPSGDTLTITFDMPTIAQLQSESSIQGGASRSKFYRFKFSQGEQ